MLPVVKMAGSVLANFQIKMSAKLAGFPVTLDSTSDDGVDDLPRFDQADVGFRMLIARAAGNSFIESSL